MKSVKSIFSFVALLLIGVVATVSQVDAHAINNLLIGINSLPHDAYNTILATGTVVAGGTITQQAVVKNDNDTLYDMKDVERKVMEYKPYQTPILTLLSQPGVQRSRCASWRKDYYAVDARGMETTITSATAIDPSSKITSITVADNSIFTLYNTVYFKDINTITTKISSGRFLVGIITGFDTSIIKVKLINPGNTLANTDFTSGMKVYRGGTAQNEVAASTTAWGNLPEKDYNYVQLFMEQVEESEYQSLIKKEADWGLADVKRLAIEDFKLQIERSFAAGIRSETTISVDNQNKRFYMCGGVLNDTQIPTIANQNLSTLTALNLTGWLKNAFVANNGSMQRYLFAGCDMAEKIEALSWDKKWIMAKEKDVVLGVETVSLVSTFGKVNIMYYPQMDLLGFQKSGIILDTANLQICDFIPFGIRDLNYKDTGIKNVTANVLEQASTILIKNKKTHTFIQGV